MSAAPDIDDVQLSRRVTWLCRLLGVGGSALIAVTWKLWTPQDVFPRVPLFAWAPLRWWDWASLAALTAGLAGLCLPVHYRRLSAAAVAAGFAIQFLADQHRLQPWAWQFFILAVVIALADDRAVFRGWFMLVISIYGWSALSKVDEEFHAQFTSLICRMLMTPWQAAGLKWTPLGREWLYRAAGYLALLPMVVELAIALLALFVRTRRWAFRVSALMHLYLVMLLGPWGLGHQPGVLVWNLFFIGQNALLFGDRSITFPIRGWQWTFDRPLSGTLGRTRRRVCEGFLMFVMLWPALEPWGYCDAWLGWAVYVPRFQEVEIRLAENSLPPADSVLAHYSIGPPYHVSTILNFPRTVLSTREWSESHSHASPERTIRVAAGKMSLDLLLAPKYPNHRLLVGAALDWQQRYDLREMDVIVLKRKNRFQSQFQHLHTYTTPAEIEAYARTFRVNALPESVLRRQANEL
jgi:hypothetical protein